MESMGIIGFIFGLAGLSFAITAKNELAKLKEDFESFREELKNSGASVSKDN